MDVRTFDNTFTKMAETIQIKTNANDADCKLAPILQEKAVSVYRLTVSKNEAFVPSPIVLEWKVPSVNVKGLWKPTADFSKRIEADWELTTLESRISIDAPVLCLFGNKDENILCFSCSNPVNRVELSAKYREEDNLFYCQVILFTECNYPISDFSIDIRLDHRNIHFSEALRNTALWWENSEDLKPMNVPAIAKKPLYSTWYQFHQDLEEELLLAECTLAHSLGFEAIIIDDGWQTKDNNRGYDYTGDWEPDRFEDFGGLVKKIQAIGMKVGVWYSIPFCGKKSKAYTKFKGKFLTENHRWAPVFDPRYPEVRQYLVQTYVGAVTNWGLDGLKLDFIDDFKKYPETTFDPSGKDTLSINTAVDLLLKAITNALLQIRPDIFIEFRQKYTGPAIRKYGNMLRAFDCPGDYTMNRVRITDIKLLAGNTAVHADMVTWHAQETVEIAALHYMNTLFGVPQISIMLTKATPEHLKMIAFYTRYWNENHEVLLSSDFLPTSPTENYPLLIAQKNNHTIIGLFSDTLVKLPLKWQKIDIINAKPSSSVLLSNEKESPGTGVSFQVWDCMGNITVQSDHFSDSEIQNIAVPPGGMLSLTREG
ncbi:glycoside hydrolase family 36 protein [Maribacter sp. 2-571]|uniref:glycoside hydrolase family 36 protein n=1 Tax=Maribacter sp. 2-571 TaxID=3417569 RepID=UPI003D3265F8